ncbi:hypothetical protein ACN26Y_18845 [Micromonospora sp. WMMD558]|uniref:hypothetical protein n=1 Tax=unclassified Micromonospora TaxID=2617518 RepID=UPI001E5A56E3|nr:hypothetical protein [Micromonospora sp. WMMC415]
MGLIVLRHAEMHHLLRDPRLAQSGERCLELMGISDGPLHDWHPELAGRLRGLVLFATWAGRILDRAPQNRLQIPLLETGVLQRIARTRTGGVLFGAAQCGTRPSPAMISVFREVFVRQNHQPLIPIVRAFSREDHYPRLDEITVPTVVVVGSADRSTPPSHSHRLAAGVPGARLVTVTPDTC